MSKKNGTDRFIQGLALTTLAIGFIGLFVTVVVYWSHGHIHWKGDVNPQDIGPFGDFIGGFIGTIFTLATALLVWLTYRSQKAELKATQDALWAQVFESGLNSRIQNFINLVSSMDLRNEKQEVIRVGRDCFKTVYKNFEDRYNQTRTSMEQLDIETTLKAYNTIQDNHKNDLHNYFMTLYRILKHIKQEPELDDDDRYEYAADIRGLLSPYELVIIFYNGLHDFGKTKFKPLLEEFSFFNNIDDSLLRGQNIKNEYHPLAFAESEEREKIVNRMEVKESKPVIAV